MFMYVSDNFCVDILYTWKLYTANMENLCIFCGKSEEDDMYHNKWVCY